MHERVSLGEKWGCGGGVLMRNVLRRGESSWLCMKFEFVFIAGHSILIRVLLPSFIVITVNELCLQMRYHAFFANEIPCL
jgi:hypothetical protein